MRHDDDDNKHLTHFAHLLVSSDVSEEQWTIFWANTTFLKFINNCASHPPAVNHVETLTDTITDQLNVVHVRNKSSAATCFFLMPAGTYSTDGHFADSSVKTP